LITTGPYALVRHPIYTGILTGFFGTAIALSQVRGLIGFVPLFFGWGQAPHGGAVDDRYVSRVTLTLGMGSHSFDPPHIKAPKTPSTPARNAFDPSITTRYRRCRSSPRSTRSSNNGQGTRTSNSCPPTTSNFWLDLRSFLCYFFLTTALSFQRDSKPELYPSSGESRCFLFSIFN
jgi:hypothetical protein